MCVAWVEHNPGNEQTLGEGNRVTNIGEARQWTPAKAVIQGEEKIKACRILEACEASEQRGRVVLHSLTFTASLSYQYSPR
jgi:hypothetical protein